MSTDELFFDAEFDALVATVLEQWKVPGLSIAVLHGPNTYSKAYGFAELPDRKMTTDTLFPAASTTKAFTGAATSIMIAASTDSDSSIDWDTPLVALIPEDFALADDYVTQRTTLEDALSHRTGLPDHNWTFAFTPKDASVPEFVRSLRHFPLTDPFRTTYRYSNHMYVAVSHALQQRTGESLGCFLRKHIWAPLGMYQTYFSVAEALSDPKNTSRLANGYTWVPEQKGGSYVLESPLDWKPNLGAGSNVSNVLDYSLWVRELIERNGPLKGHDSLVKPRTFHFETGDIHLPSPYHAYALGWYVDHHRGHSLYTHAGGWPGYGSLVGFMPDKRIGFAMMGNTNLARNASFTLMLYLFDKLLGVSSDPEHTKQLATCFTQQEEERMNRMRLENIEEGKRRLFPSLPDPPLPHSVSLEKYAGTYRHPSNASFTLELNDRELTADLSQNAIPSQLSLTHASGEFFVGTIRTVNLASMHHFVIEFYVDPTGTVSKVGLLLEPAMKEEKLWFGRDEEV